MTRKFCILVFAVMSLIALSVFSASASPPAKSTKVSGKQTAKAAQSSTATAAACDEQVILNEQLTAKVTGALPELEAISRSDFKIDASVLPLDGYAGKVEHVPIEKRVGHPPVESEVGSFY
jgi:hypothetical protein